VPLAHPPGHAQVAEAFLDGHVSAFAFFGGVPISILYDETLRLKNLALRTRCNVAHTFTKRQDC
jgi:transposase